MSYSSIDNMLNREIEILERQLSEGKISSEQYNKEFRELHRDARNAEKEENYKDENY